MSQAETVSPDALGTRISLFATPDRPFIVGIDGRSGVGKSTMARRLAGKLGAQVVDGDAFFAGGVGVQAGTRAARVDACIDRLKLASVLADLRAGRPARYRPFDWDAFDGRLHRAPVRVPRCHLYLVEGVYTCHPELHAYLDTKVLTVVPPHVREARLLGREGGVGPWEKQWHEAEDWYFSTLMPSGGFDVIVDTGA